MRYFKVFISFLLLLSLTGCMTNTTEEESGVCVVVEDEKISINHKSSDIQVSSDDMSVLSDDNNLIQQITLKTDQYELDNGDHVGMSVDQLKEAHEDIYGQQIDSSDGKNIIGKYGIVYSNQNIKVVYTCKNNTVYEITLSTIFDF